MTQNKPKHFIYKRKDGQNNVLISVVRRRTDYNEKEIPEDMFYKTFEMYIN